MLGFGSRAYDRFAKVTPLPGWRVVGTFTQRLRAGLMTDAAPRLALGCEWVGGSGIAAAASLLGAIFDGFVADLGRGFCRPTHAAQ